jgi:hypothetical protein
VDEAFVGDFIHEFEVLLAGGSLEHCSAMSEDWERALEIFRYVFQTSLIEFLKGSLTLGEGRCRRGLKNVGYKKIFQNAQSKKFSPARTRKIVLGRIFGTYCGNRNAITIYKPPHTKVDNHGLGTPFAILNNNNKIHQLQVFGSRSCDRGHPNEKL